MANTIIVVSSRTDAKVVLHQYDPQHPGGEIFVANSAVPGTDEVIQNPVEVFRTAEVDAAIHANQMKVLTEDEAMDLISSNEEKQSARASTAATVAEARMGIGARVAARRARALSAMGSSDGPAVHLAAPGEGLNDQAIPGVPGVSNANMTALYAAGYDSWEKIDAATDEQLDAVPGIGEATVRALRNRPRE